MRTSLSILLIIFPVFIGLSKVTITHYAYPSDLCFDIATKNSDRAIVVGYVEKVARIALKLSHAVGVPTSIILAQAILEGGAGRSHHAKVNNNHFGISYYSISTCQIKYRKYKNYKQSFIHHTQVLAEKYPHLLRNKDIDLWARSLQGTYCPSETYAQNLKQIISTYKLDRYDNICSPLK